MFPAIVALASFAIDPLQQQAESVAQSGPRYSNSPSDLVQLNVLFYPGSERNKVPPGERPKAALRAMAGKRLLGMYELQDENQWRKAITEGVDIELSRGVPESQSQALHLEIEWPQAMPYPWSGKIRVTAISWDGVTTEVASGAALTSTTGESASSLKTWRLAEIGGEIPIPYGDKQIRLFRLFLHSRPRTGEFTVQILHAPSPPADKTVAEPRLLPSVLLTRTITEEWEWLAATSGTEGLRLIIPSSRRPICETVANGFQVRLFPSRDGQPTGAALDPNTCIELHGFSPSDEPARLPPVAAVLVPLRTRTDCTKPMATATGDLSWKMQAIDK